MLKAQSSKTSRTPITGIAATGLALPIIAGFSLTMLGAAAADTTNKQSFTAAQAQSASANLVSFKSATTPPLGKSRMRPALVDSTAVRSGPAPAGGRARVTADRVPAGWPARVTADRVPHNLTASRWSGPAPAGLTEDRVPHNLTANRSSGPALAGVTADRVPAGVPAGITADRWHGPAPGVMARSGAVATASLMPAAAAHAPVGAAAHMAMLAPASTVARDRSATTELLKSKAAFAALRKARQNAANHQR